MKPEGFPRSLRLRHRREFLQVQRNGEKHHTRHFLVFAARRDATTNRTETPRAGCLLPTRIGVTVTRKVGGAVVRNRIKHLVREAFRRNREGFAAGWDLVWVAKRDAVAASYFDVVEQMDRVARRLPPKAMPPNCSNPSNPGSNANSTNANKNGGVTA